MINLKINTPSNFSFNSTIYSHGWSDLLPFRIDPGNNSLQYSFKANGETSIKILLVSDKNENIIINSDFEIKQKDVLVDSINRIFKLNEDLSDFYTLANQHVQWKWVIDKAAGRMLRCASIWEDMVKMLCTTNCTWRLTQIMTENLVNILGNSESFPTAEIIAERDEQFLRNEIKMGYRSPYLLQFAQQVAEGTLDINQFDNWNGDSVSLYKEIKKIKGFGDYAVSSLMKLLGRYDFMGFDSWNRKQFYNIHNNGNTCSDEKITKFYNHFGEWVGLFFWLDVTKEWYFRKNPWN